MISELSAESLAEIHAIEGREKRKSISETDSCLRPLFYVCSRHLLFDLPLY